jgi:membrane dipeptidase
MISPMSTDPSKWVEAARALHAKSLVVDSHCDTTMRLMQPDWDFSALHDDGHVDTPRLRAGGVGALVLAVYAPGPMAAGEGPKAARTQLDAIEFAVKRNAETLLAARTAKDVHRAKDLSRIAVLIGIEGGYLIDDSLEVLREYHRRGAVYLTLTHAFHTSWADSSGVHESLSPLHGGLTGFGRDVVRELNRLGMMVDVSHVSDDTFRDVIEISTAPVIASHSSCRAVSPHRRNLSDEMIKAIAKTGGVVQINFAAAFVDPTFPPIDTRVLQYWSTRGGFEASPYAGHVTPLSVLADHFDHAIALVGPEHVGIGTDFDGVSAVPRGMEDCSKLPHLTAELLRRGHGETDLVKVLGANFLRVMEKCQSVAQYRTNDSTLTPAPLPERERGSQTERLLQKLQGSRLILASASPRRAQLLQDFGLSFEIVPAPEDEPPVPEAHDDAAQWAERVSLQKAQGVARRVQGGLILAGDTIATLGHRAIGKPADRAHAGQILRSLAGTTHQVITALALLDAQTGRSMVRHDVTQVRMRRLSDLEIEEYLDTGEWKGKAGAYGIQDCGDKFVERIEGSFTNVVGLPVELLGRMFSEWFAAGS